MDSTQFGMKELYDVTLKATYPVEIEGRVFETDETIASFDKIALAVVSETKSNVSAKGGYRNQSLIWWDNTKEVRLAFTQGIFSKTQFALLNNARVAKISGTSLAVNSIVEMSSDSQGVLTFSENVLTKPLFIYNASSGAKITNYTIQDAKHIKVNVASTSFIVDYWHNYSNGYSLVTIGENVIDGYFNLIGKTRVVDDITGATQTAIIHIPKLKLISTLSMRLGRDAQPIVPQLDGIALPTGTAGNMKAIEFIFLNDDIDADI